MASNFAAPGEIVDVLAPYDRTSGQGCLVGQLFGICLNTALSGEALSLQVVGSHKDVAKLSAQAWTVGACLYWDNTNKRLTTVASGNTLVGCATAIAANPSATGNIRLNGAVRPAEA